MLSEYGKVLLFIVGGCLFVLGGAFLSRLLAPHRPTPEKLVTYECGELPQGTAWTQFNMRFYAMGLIFLIFDAEILLLFPWATVFAKPEFISRAPNWGWLALAEAFVFIAILALGLAYIWAKGDINWVRPEPQRPEAPGTVPLERYETFNRREQSS